MTTEYDAIAEQYQKSKQEPFRLHIETFTLWELIGDVRGQAVLDLACGEGYHTRNLKRRGAARVVGVDLSPKMIELARQQEERQPLGIEYVVQDAAQLQLAEPFDIVTATYLFNYARSAEELGAMCRSVAGVLKPGGRLIAVNNNIAQPPASFAATRPYGFIKTFEGELREGTPITFTCWVDGATFQFVNYHLNPATYEAAFRAAGLQDLRWHRPRVAPEGLAEYGEAYWKVFLENPPLTFLTCRR